MRVQVKLKKGGSFNRRENGAKVRYTHESAPFSVGRHVYETFKDRFEVIGEAPAPLVPKAASNVPGTDDDETLNSLEDRDGDGEPDGEEEETSTTGKREGDIVEALASVNIKVDPGKVATWEPAELDRAWAVVERGGKNTLPKFITEARLPEDGPKE